MAAAPGALLCVVWATLLLAPTAAAAASAAVAAGPACETCGGSGAQDHVLLQRRHGLAPFVPASREPGEPPAAPASGRAVKPFDCASYPEPIQVLEQKGGPHDRYFVRALQVQAGTYKTLWAIPKSWTSPPYDKINGCAIGPVDHIAYCSIRIDKKGYLVRLDQHRIKFVAELPWSYRAAFDAHGTYYSVEHGRLYAVHEAHKLHDFESQSAPGLKDASGSVKVTRIGKVGADFVVVSEDLEGAGIRDYLVSVERDQVLITAMSGDGKHWSLRAHGVALPGWYGAGWSYRGRIFFASNVGSGIYEVKVATADLSALKVEVHRVGNSVPTHENDGMNCMAVKPPFPYEGSCVLWGDPHIRVFDVSECTEPGEEGQLASMLGIGDFWIVQSERIFIQARYRATPFTNGQAATNALAIGGPFLQGKTMIIESMQGKITWDGSAVLNALPSEFSVPGLLTARYRSGQGSPSLDPNLRDLPLKVVEVEMPLGVRVTVNRWTDHIDVRITMPPQAPQDGHCGNFNGDPSDDTTELLEERVGAEVAPEDLLFPPAGPASVVQSRPVTVEDDCPPATRARAEELCGNLRELLGCRSTYKACVFDVCFGGEDYAKTGAAMVHGAAAAGKAVSVRWRAHTAMCLGVGIEAGGPGTVSEGALLQKGVCDADWLDRELLLPEADMGQIRLASHPELCLKVVDGGARLEFWNCVPGQSEMQFKLGDAGTIESVSSAACLEGWDKWGAGLRLGRCAGGDANQEFFWD